MPNVMQDRRVLRFYDGDLGIELRFDKVFGHHTQTKLMSTIANQIHDDLVVANYMLSVFTTILCNLHNLCVQAYI